MRMAQFLRDLRLAVRSLTRTPAFTLVALATLTIGIGANTAMFNVAHAVLWRPLPVHEPDRLMQVWETNPLRGWVNNVASPANFADWRSRNTVFSGMAGYTGADQSGQGSFSLFLTGHGEPQRLKILRVTGNFFGVLGAQPMLGRTFVDEETFADRPATIVLSYGLWQSALGGEPNIVGRTIPLNGRNWQVIGVMPKEFFYPSREIQAWVTLRAPRAMFVESRRPHFMSVIARLKPGLELGQARAEMSTIASQLEREYPDTNTKMGVGLGPLRDWMVGDSKPGLLMLIGAVGLLLLIVCANVANLQLSRSAGRIREMTIRTALGASRHQLIQQMLAEGLVLSATAGTLGLGLAYTLREALLSVAPNAAPMLSEVRIDAWVVAFTLGISLTTTLLFGLLPAFQASRSRALNERGGTSGTSFTRFALVAAEVAVSVMLVIGAGLLVKSLLQLQNVNPGFNPERTLTFNLTFPGIRYPDDDKAVNAVLEIERRLKAGPQVTAVGSTTMLALRGSSWTGDATVEGRGANDYERELRHKAITPGYFRAMGLPLLKGRELNEFDNQKDAAAVTVVNETLARRYFRGEDPIGKRVKFGRPQDQRPWITVVGVVGDEKQDSMSKAVQPEVYSPLYSDNQNLVSVAIRTTSNPASLIEFVRGEVRAFDKDLAVADALPMREVVYGSVGAERFRTWLLSSFAAVALLLAAIGIYGVLSYLVTQRTREIGIRMALGAERSTLLRMVLGQGMGPVFLGVAVGLVGAAAATRTMTKLLFNVSAGDLGTYALTTGVLVVIAATACSIPALRATRVDPVVALRDE